MLYPEVALLPDEDAVDDHASHPTVSPAPTVADRRPRHRGRRVALVLIAAAALVASTSITTAWAAGGFSDVPDGHPFQTEIGWMDAHNISNGYPDGTFRPTANVSRQALAAFLSKYNSQITTHVANFDTDVAVNVTAASATCPGGKTPISGGGSTDQSDVFMTDSYAQGSEWLVRWETDNDATALISGHVWVTCKPDDSST